MQMRVELQERIPGELQYRTVSDPALGVWHGSAAGVKVFTHIQQVSNLSAPAVYRGVVHFRWVNAKGRTIKVRGAVARQSANSRRPAETSAPTGGARPAPPPARARRSRRRRSSARRQS